MHLDPETYGALLAGELAPERARAVSQHLVTACDVCERFLAEREETDPLDGVTDALIASALPPSERSGHDLELARGFRRQRRAGARRPVLFLGALAASLVVAGVAGLVARQLRAPAPTEARWDGVKGTTARPLPLRLRFLLLDPGGGVRKGISGGVAERASSVLFEVEAGRPAYVALARVSPGGGVELFWKDHVGSGRTQVTAAGKTAAYPLGALSGPTRFVLLASDGGLDDARAVRAASALAAPGRLQPASPSIVGLSIDVADIVVR